MFKLLIHQRAPISSFDDDFGEFEGGSTLTTSGSDPFAPRGGRPANLTSADWNSEFKSSFDDASPLENPFAGGDSEDEDNFGDFQATPQITVPSFDSDNSFDFGPTQTFDPTSPSDATTEDGSSHFGALRSNSPEAIRTTPRSDGLVEGHTSDGETVVVPPDEMEMQKGKSKSRSASSSSDGSFS